MLERTEDGFKKSSTPRKLGRVEEMGREENFSDTCIECRQTERRAPRETCQLLPKAPILLLLLPKRVCARMNGLPV